MLFQSFLISSLAFETFSLAAPVPAPAPAPGFSLVKRAVTVFATKTSTSVNPKISGVAVSTTKRDELAIIERQSDIGGKADAAGAVADVISKAVSLVQGMIDGDIVRRQAFTKETIAALAVTFPGKNIVMSNVGYTFTGTVDVKQTTSYKAKVGSNVSYDVLVFGAGGTFTLQGDGGFENWAYVPVTCKGDAAGKVLTC